VHGSAEASIGHVNYRLLENLEKLLDPACVFEKKERKEKEIRKNEIRSSIFLYIYTNIFYLLLNII